jgi:HK97 family phage prohead protease
MPVKGMKFEVKEILGDAGEFIGLASVFGNVDAGGDLVEHGAFTKTLADKNGEVPILWAHDAAAIVGIGRLRETQQGLEVHGQLVLDSNDVGQRAYSLLKAGAVKGLSIGYDVARSLVKDGVRHLKELKLYEVSLTAFPMNAQATVTAVKAVDHRGELFLIACLREMIRKARD